MPRLGFCFTAYRVPGALPPQATVEVVREGRSLAWVPIALPEAVGGRIQYAGTLPLASLPDGELELRVSVTDGHSVQTRRAAFSVVE